MTSSRPPPASANLASPARNHRRPPGPDMTEHLPAGPAPASPAAPARGKPAAGLPAAKKLYIQTHGCQMNEYDSARMADVLAAADGLELTDDVTEADVVLVNTCSIREKAQEKVFSQLGRWKSLKADGKPVIIGVGGCVASPEGEAIVKRAPYVDLVFGPQTLHPLPELRSDEQTSELQSLMRISYAGFSLTK